MLSCIDSFCNACEIRAYVQFGAISHTVESSQIALGICTFTDTREEQHDPTSWQNTLNTNLTKQPGLGADGYLFNGVGDVCCLMGLFS